MAHQRQNKCTFLAKKHTEKSSLQQVNNTPIELEYNIKNEFVNILKNVIDEDLSLDIRKSKDEPNKFIHIEKDLLRKMIVWYYITTFNNKTIESRDNESFDDITKLDTHFKTFLRLEEKRLLLSREYKIRLLQDTMKSLNEYFKDNIINGFINKFY